MPVDQAISATVTVAGEATQLASAATQTVVDTTVSATPDQIGNVLDAAINIGNMLPHSQGSWIAIVLAGLVIARMLWKKYQASKK